MTAVQLAAMRRTVVPEEERVDFACYLDEFHNFTTDAFASILAEARKYRLSLVLGHQYLAQISPAVRAAVFGNVGTLVSFQLGYDDAEALAGEFAPYVPGGLDRLLPRRDRRAHGDGRHHRRAVPRDRPSRSSGGATAAGRK